MSVLYSPTALTLNPGLHHRSIVIEALKSRNGDATVAFFYCEYQDERKRDPRNILSTILSDLIRPLRSHLPPSLTSLVSDILASNAPTTIELLGNMIRMISNEHSRPFIVIDALDECDERATLFPALRQISQHASVFVTSRDERDIRMGLAQFWRYSIRMNSEDIADEITTFVTTVVTYRVCAGSLCVGNANLVEEIIQALISGSDGM